MPLVFGSWRMGHRVLERELIRLLNATAVRVAKSLSKDRVFPARLPDFVRAA